MRLRPSSQSHARNRARCRKPRHARLPITAPVRVLHRKTRRKPPKPDLKHFPRFNDLPDELQLIIWNLSLPPPRTIRIIEACLDGFLIHRFVNVTIPPILHVCRKTREEYIKHYEYVSLSPTSRGSAKLIQQWKRQQKCYINFEKDIIFLYAEKVHKHVQLSGRGLFKAIGECSKKITHIAVENDVPTAMHWVLSLRHLQKLRRIDIVCNGFINLYQDEVYFHRPIEENEPLLLDWYEIIASRQRLSWKRALQEKAESLGLSVWSRPPSLDFVTLRSSKYYNQHEGPHFTQYGRMVARTFGRFRPYERLLIFGAT